jgi:transposase-like protein
MTSKNLGTLWGKRLTEYEASDKSVVAWCKEQSIRESQFYYWRRKLRLDQAEKEQPVKWLSLVDVELCKQTSLPADSMSVHIGQVIVEIKKGFDHQLFREIVAILQTK